MLAALAYAGFELADGAAAWLLGLGAPALAVAVWAAFVAPKAARPVPTDARLGIEFALFGLAVGGLVAVDRPVPGLVLGVAAATTSIANARLEDRGA
jgi:hypothetical protein